MVNLYTLAHMAATALSLAACIVLYVKVRSLEHERDRTKRERDVLQSSLNIAIHHSERLEAQLQQSLDDCAMIDAVTTDNPDELPNTLRQLRLRYIKIIDRALSPSLN